VPAVDIEAPDQSAPKSAKETDVLNAEPTPEQPHAPPVVEHRILRLDEVQAKTGFKRAHLYKLMQKNQFPRAVRLGVRAVGWNSVEVEQWVLERLARQV